MKSALPLNPQPGFPRPAMSRADLLRSLMEFDSALLANTLLYIDPTPAEQLYMGGSIQCQTPAIGPMVGVAVTCEVDSSSPGQAGRMEPFYEHLAEMSRQPGPLVWVVKAVGSRPDHECVFGDGMAKLLHSVGCVGIVTDGGCATWRGYAPSPSARVREGP